MRACHTPRVSKLLFHWGDAVRANAPALNDAGWPWKQNQPDPHFEGLNGDKGDARSGEIGDQFIRSIQARGGGNNAKGGVGYYTSTDFLKWYGWEGGFDLLVVEPKAPNEADLTREGPGGPIMKVMGGINPLINRAPTEEEKQRGVHLMIRPPTRQDVKSIFPRDKDPSTQLQFLDALVTRTSRSMGIDRRTESVKATFRALIFEEGFDAIMGMDRGWLATRRPSLEKITQEYRRVSRTGEAAKIPDLAGKLSRLESLLASL